MRKKSPPRHTAQVIDFLSRAVDPSIAAAPLFEAAMRDSNFEVVAREGRCIQKTSRESLLAANDSFQAWERLPDTMEALGAMWHGHGVNARLAYGSMTSPQSVLVEIWRSQPAADVDQMLAGIVASSEILKVAAQAMDIALIRFAAAREAAARKDRPAKRGGSRR